MEFWNWMSDRRLTTAIVIFALTGLCIGMSALTIIHWLMPLQFYSKANEIDVLQHLDYFIIISEKVPNGQTITYKDFAVFVAAVKSSNPNMIYSVEGHKDLWFWNDKISSIYFTDNYGVIYLYS